MPAQIVVGETDDPYFIQLANRVVSGLLVRNKPEKTWIIQIDNWFDHKWLKYSGYGLVASNIPMDRYDSKGGIVPRESNVPTVYTEQSARAVVLSENRKRLQGVCVA